MRSTDLKGLLLRRTHPSLVFKREAHKTTVVKAAAVATCPCRDPETVAAGEQLLAHRYRRCRDCRDDGWRNPGDRPRRDKKLSTGPLESQLDAERLWPSPVARCTPRQFASV